METILEHIKKLLETLLTVLGYASGEEVFIGELTVTASGQTVEGSFEIDDRHKRFVAFAVTSDLPKLAYLRGSSFFLRIGKVELIPENFPLQLLMASIHHAPNQKFKSDFSSIMVNGERIKVTYKDTNHPDAAFQSYKVRLFGKFLPN